MHLTEKEFLELVENHRGIICKVSRAYFRHDEDRQDLAQEIVLQCWRSLSSFRGDSAFSTWLYRIALNTAVVFSKKEARRKRHISNGPHEMIASEPVDEAELTSEQIYLAINKLDGIEKAIILQYIDGISGREISQHLEMTEGAVRVRINRIKKKLQSLLGRRHEL